MIIKHIKGQPNIPNGHNIYIPTKWSWNLPTSFITKPSKIYPNWDFWFENMPSGNPVKLSRPFLVLESEGSKKDGWRQSFAWLQEIHQIYCRTKKSIRPPFRAPGQDCQFFLVATHQKWEKYTKKATNCSKRSQNIHEMLIKYTKYTKISIPRPSKIYQNRNFWFKNIPSGNPAPGCICHFLVSFWAWSKGPLPVWPDVFGKSERNVTKIRKYCDNVDECIFSHFKDLSKMVSEFSPSLNRFRIIFSEMKFRPI
jgi:hypothetical protein